MKPSVARLFAIIPILLTITDAWAWNGPGHMTVAAIAYRDLSPTEREKLDLILKSHPQFQSWQSDFPASVPNLDLGLYVTMAASLWPDQIRKRNDPSTFPNWHFVDYPLIAPSFPFRGSPMPRDDILFGIGKSEAFLRSSTALAQDKAEKMSWLIHLVGDVHQPLHCATLINSAYPAPEGDHGGNGFFVRASPTSEPQKLHSLWDGLLGVGTVADAGLTRSALNDAIRLQTLYPRSTLPELQSHRSVKSWSKESRQSAIHDAYLDGALPPGENATNATILPVGYTRRAKEIAERRVALAGYRLADEIRRTIR
ncbi:MAG TPA: S1/P1 nuclease [Terrimicrobiaceae bacterium]